MGSRMRTITWGCGLLSLALSLGCYRGGPQSAQDDDTGTGEGGGSASDETGGDGEDELVARLGRLDPAALRRIDPSNRRRLLRALEVCESTGQPFSSFGPGLDVYASTPHRLVGLRVDRGALATRIRMRVTAMLDAGWLDEVAGLTERGPWSRTAAQAIGYRELAEHLAGRSSLAEAVDATVQRTRRFAVRQMRWFARDPRIVWFDAESPSIVDQVADTVCT